MSDPFRIEGPAIISFSGGRTSAYMLWRIIQAHGGKLPQDVWTVFCNTGREAPETLDFVQACSDHWNEHIVWLERRPGEHGARYEIVDHQIASRAGEPFAALIGEKSYLPNAVTRFCTSELKIRPMRDFARHHLKWEHWNCAVGLRADEPHRVARIRAHNDAGRERWDLVAPLAAARVTVADVTAFWQRQNFDLRLHSSGGKAPGGNCDLCFLKATSTLIGQIAERPERADWWIAQEDAVGGATFRKRTRPLSSYRDLKRVAVDQPRLALEAPDDATTECFCHD